MAFLRYFLAFFGYFLSVNDLHVTHFDPGTYFGENMIFRNVSRNIVWNYHFWPYLGGLLRLERSSAAPRNFHFWRFYYHFFTYIRSANRFLVVGIGTYFLFFVEGVLATLEYLSTTVDGLFHHFLLYWPLFRSIRLKHFWHVYSMSLKVNNVCVENFRIWLFCCCYRYLKWYMVDIGYDKCNQ